MIRKIIRIDEEKCNGCGACANACHEGAIEMVNGKARLQREDSATASAIACRIAPRARFLLKNGKRLLITQRP